MYDFCCVFFKNIFIDYEHEAYQYIWLNVNGHKLMEHYTNHII